MRNIIQSLLKPCWHFYVPHYIAFKDSYGCIAECVWCRDHIQIINNEHHDEMFPMPIRVYIEMRDFG